MSGNLPELVAVWTDQIAKHWEEHEPHMLRGLTDTQKRRLSRSAAESCAVSVFAVKIRRDLEAAGLPLSKEESDERQRDAKDVRP